MASLSGVLPKEMGIASLLTRSLSAASSAGVLFTATAAKSGLVFGCGPKGRPTPANGFRIEGSEMDGSSGSLRPRKLAMPPPEIRVLIYNFRFRAHSPL